MKFLDKLFKKQDKRRKTREYIRWATGWKRNALYRNEKGKLVPLTRSMIRRVGSRERAIQLGLIKA